MRSATVSGRRPPAPNRRRRRWRPSSAAPATRPPAACVSPAATRPDRLFLSSDRLPTPAHRARGLFRFRGKEHPTMARRRRQFRHPGFPRRPGRPAGRDLGWPMPDGYAEHTPTAGQLAWRAARAYGRWVARSPETRGLASGLAALYPAGDIAHLAGADPAWLATAAATGITSLPVLAGYTSAATLAWSAVTWSDVLRHRRAWKAQQARWDTIAAAAGLEHSRLIAADDTRTGQRFRVDIRGTGKTATQLARGDLAERIAGAFGLPAERVRVSADRGHAGVLVILVQTTDPWAQPVTHPALDPAHRPLPVSVMAGPLALGTDPDSGADLELTVYDKGGAWHTFILAATGGGKTTLYSNIAEQATARNDVLVMGIDLRKGTIPFFWGPALDACAGLNRDGTPQFDKALAILDWGTRIIKLRSAASGGKNHIPRPDDPAILILIDEGDTLLGLDSPIAYKAKPLVQDIWRGGRSAGVGVAFAGQRGIVQYTGSKDVHANAGNKIVLRVNRSAEMGNAVPDWEADQMPDMHTYAEGVHAAAPGISSGTHSQAPGTAPRDELAIRRLTRDLPAKVDASLADMPGVPGNAISLADLAAARNAINNAETNDPAANRAIPIPPQIAEPVLNLLSNRGDTGARRDEIVTTVGRSRSAVAKWLAIMRDHGLVTAHGSTSAARYYLPEHDPGGEDLPEDSDDAA